MQVPEKSVKKYQEIMKRKHGKDIPDASAHEQCRRLLVSFDVIGRISKRDKKIEK